jgi:sRNA-binding carbon storage regulator CsrA
MSTTKRALKRSLARHSAGIVPEARGLSLSRKDGEAIVIELPDGRDITVTLLQSLHRRCRLHVAAPRDYPIRRGELSRRVSQAAAQGAA